jgi:hypothetical protein
MKKSFIEIEINVTFLEQLYKFMVLYTFSCE